MLQQSQCVKSKPSNVIFLDIDGVMNSYGSLLNNEFIDISCLRRIKNLSDSTNSDIVVISTWRLGENVKSLQKMFYPFGPTRIIGATGAFSSSNDFRGSEIDEWVSKYGCLEYVIIDDDHDYYPDQLKRTVHPDAYTGISETDVIQAKNILHK